MVGAQAACLVTRYKFFTFITFMTFNVKVCKFQSTKLLHSFIQSCISGLIIWVHKGKCMETSHIVKMHDHHVAIEVLRLHNCHHSLKNGGYWSEN